MQNTRSTFHAVKQPMKRWKIVVIVIGCILILPVVLVVASVVISTILDSFDRAKFEGLDKNSQVIFDTVKLKSYGSETWTYSKKCDAELAGDWPTGKYDCYTKIATEVPVTNVNQLTRLHDKYYAIIDASTFLKTRTPLDKVFPDEFGIKFVVSGAEKQYNMIDNDVICTYLAKLNQPHDQFNSLDYSYGSPILDGKGLVTVSLTCKEIATGDWYK